MLMFYQIKSKLLEKLLQTLSEPLDPKSHLLSLTSDSSLEAMRILDLTHIAKESHLK